MTVLDTFNFISLGFSDTQMCSSGREATGNIVFSVLIALIRLVPSSFVVFPSRFLVMRLL